MLFEFIIGLVRDIICLHIGAAFLRLITLGKYSTEGMTENDKTKVEVVGLFVLAGLIILTWIVLGLIL
jgi:hypothetical protein